MTFKNIDLIQFELNEAYWHYFNWFKQQRNYLKEGVITSHPFFINIKTQFLSLRKEINDTDIILVYWQETYWYPSKNWINHKLLRNSNIGEFFSDNSFNDSIFLNELCSYGFDFPNFEKKTILLNDERNNTNFKSHFQWPFWNLIKNIRNKNKYIVWSNIIKFDVYRENSPKRRIRKTEILKNEREKFYNIHRELIKNEIKIINPWKIIFLSSPNETNSIYNEILSWLLEFNDNISENCFKTGTILNLQNSFIQSFHPRRLNLDERSKLVKFI